MMDDWKCIFNFLRNCQMVFHQWLCNFTFPPAVQESFASSTPLPILVWSVSIITPFIGVQWCLTLALIAFPWWLLKLSIFPCAFGVFTFSKVWKSFVSYPLYKKTQEAFFKDQKGKSNDIEHPFLCRFAIHMYFLWSIQVYYPCRGGRKPFSSFLLHSLTGALQVRSTKYRFIGEKQSLLTHAMCIYVKSSV